MSFALFTRDYPELGIRFQTPSTGLETMVFGEPGISHIELLSALLTDGSKGM
jgi:hypothetical protein